MCILFDIFSNFVNDERESTKAEEFGLSPTLGVHGSLVEIRIPDILLHDLIRMKIQTEY